ncbi:hypothetical protein PEL8287_01769 [Roseovarius litorisediminis]|uniref:Uncharacterized protein n=1 Tax=Roseovarius litorisediminis TaxID=1312363 RepID=A0A1Y5SDC3_9RHOB|nr:hypothetical protein [Roseovarius litorisediminis]SLN37062.1 hypothetical protein PEL8287_01769 [Roseovarius litorisediminis]
MSKPSATVSTPFGYVILFAAILVFAFGLFDASYSGPGIKATSSFKAPKGCKPDSRLAAQFNAVQACIERFSDTHEFVLLLQEKRYSTAATSKNEARKSVKKIARSYLSDLRRTNSKAVGQSMELFKSFDYKTSAVLPIGAEFCTSANAIVIDRHVPGYIGDEFRIWMQTDVCTRFDPESRTVQLVELRASERFRVATAGSLVLERFKYLTPLGMHQKAMKTLRLY